MNLSSCKRRTLIDIYYLYPNKKNLPHIPGVVRKPFIKHSECTDNKLSADWQEWNTVIALYLSKLKDFLEEGNSIELGSRLGVFHLTKLKTPKFLDFKKSKEQGKRVYLTKTNADNYYIMTSWSKVKVTMKLKHFWRIKINRSWVRSIYTKCESDYTKIYKIRDAR